jgi:hypothetical protein
MRVRAVFGVVVVVVGVAAVVLGGAGGAGAVAGSITVTPDTGLHDLQTVTVSGSSFAAGKSLSVAQCRIVNGTTAGVCYGATRVDVTTDGSGAFTMAFVVRRLIVESGSPVDCASAPDTCGIAVDGPASGSLVVAPLSFDASVPAAPPTLTVTPDRDLADGASVTVTGAHFTPSAAVDLRQCISGTFALESCDPGSGGSATTDASGSFTTTVAVHTTITITSAGATPSVPAGPHDCRVVNDCTLVAANAQGASEFAAAPTLFVPLTEPTPPPTTNPSLAFTGGGTRAPFLVLAGLALLLAGAALIRRRGMPKGAGLRE